MAEILVRAVDGTCRDPSANPLRGMPVVVMEDGHRWGTAEGPPEYIVVKIPGAAVDGIRQICRPCPRPSARAILGRRIKYTLRHAVGHIFSRPFANGDDAEGAPAWRRRQHRVSEEVLAAAAQGNVTLAEFAKGLVDLMQR